MYPKQLKDLIDAFKKLPGVGKKSAERLSFSMLNWQKKDAEHFALCIQQAIHTLSHCEACGALKGDEECVYCDTKKRDSSSMCIVAHPRDVFVIEETRIFNGLYHVLNGLLSPIHGRGETSLSIDKLLSRIKKHDVKEVILAIESTLEGDATALLLKEKLEANNVTMSRLALGIPLGSSLDFVDEATLNRALLGRQPF